MTRFLTRFALFVVPLFVTAGAAFYIYDLHAQSSAQSKVARKLIPAPSDWIAFDAVQAQQLGNGRVVAGRFFQGADGSTRLESGYELDQPLVIDIKNIEQKRYYVRSQNGTWTSGPMFPREPFSPPQYATGGGIDNEPFPGKVKGFDAYRRQKTGKWQNDQGEVKVGTITEYVAPTLNFLTVRSESTMGGWIEYNDITLRPQPKELFMPPPGAKVVDTNEPGGFISAGEARKAGIDYGKTLKEHNEKAHKEAHKK